MTKLPTLKDLEILKGFVILSRDNPTEYMGDWVDIKDLKQMAIEWVKVLGKEPNNFATKSHRIAQQAIIMQIFNITEHDLNPYELPKCKNTGLDSSFNITEEDLK